MQPEWGDLFLIAAMVLFAHLVDWQRRREREAPSRQSAAIAKETAAEARAVADQHERALRKALKEVR